MLDSLVCYKYFVAVATEGSVTAAAKKLYVSQPAISFAISKLEEILSTVLFYRGCRGMVLTEEGKKLYAYASHALSLLDAGEQELLHTTHPVRIATPSVAIQPLLTHKIKPFYSLCPHSSILFSPLNSREDQELSKQGKLDFAVLPFPISQPNSSFHQVSLGSLSFLWVHSPRYPVSKQMKREDLVGYRLLLPKWDASDLPFPLAALTQRELSVSPALVALEEETLLDFATDGCGIAYVSQEAAKPYLDSGRLQAIELEEPFPPTEFFLTYSDQYPLSTEAKVFWQFFDR
jgi:DNA-binding transcriptional LysR family regulator